MFSGLHSKHIPFGICRCMNHHHWHKYAGSHVPGNRNPNLKKERLPYLTWSPHWTYYSALTVIICWGTIISIWQIQVMENTGTNQRQMTILWKNLVLKWLSFLVCFYHKFLLTFVAVHIIIRVISPHTANYLQASWPSAVIFPVCSSAAFWPR